MEKKLKGFHLPIYVIEKLESMAKEKGINMSYVVRRLIEKAWDERDSKGVSDEET